MVQNDGEHGWRYYWRWKISLKLFVQESAYIFCTGANLEEDIMNLVAHSHYERVPNYRDLTLKTNGIY
jgi:deoxyhypusine synthase